MKKIIFGLIGGFLAAAELGAAVTAGPELPSEALSSALLNRLAPSEIHWETGYAAALRSTRETGKPLLLYFYNKKSTWCAKLESETLSGSAIMAELAKMTTVRLDADRYPELVDQYRLARVPALVVVMPDGRVAVRHEGFIASTPLLELLRRGSPDKTEDRANQVAEWLKQERISAEQWLEIVQLAGRDYRHGAVIRTQIAAKSPFPAAALVPLLTYPRLSVRTAALEILSERAGGDFGFEPWSDPGMPANAAALAKWRQWAKSAAPGERNGIRLDRERTGALINQLVIGQEDHSVRAIEQLLDSGRDALQQVDEYGQLHPDLSDESRRRLREIRYALMLPRDLNPRPTVSAHQLVFGNLEQRQQAVMRLSTCTAAWPILVECLNDDESLVRESAVDAITVGKRPEAGKVIEARLAKESDKEVLFGIIRNLSRIQTPRSVTLLTGFLKSPHEEHVIAALDSLKIMRANIAKKAIVNCLDDSRWRVQVAALEAAGEMNIAEAGAVALKLMSNGQDVFVRRKALETLAKIKYTPALKKLPAFYFGDDRFKGAIIQAYCTMDRPVPPEFIDGLKNKSDEVLLTVVQDLDECTDNALGIGIYLSDSPQPDIAVPAASFLARNIDRPEAVAALTLVLPHFKPEAILNVLERSELYSDRLEPFKAAMTRILRRHTESAGKKTDRLEELYQSFDSGAGTGANAKPLSINFLLDQLAAAFSSSGKVKLRLSQDPYPDFVSMMESFYRQQGNEELHRRAGIMLLMFGDAAPLTEFTAAFSTLPEEIQTNILAALGAYSERPETITILKTALRSDRKTVVIGAAKIIMEMKQPPIQQLFVDVLNDPHSALPVFDLLDQSRWYIDGKPSFLLRTWAEKVLDERKAAWERQILALFVLQSNWRRTDLSRFRHAANASDLRIRMAALQLLAHRDFKAFLPSVAKLATSEQPELRRLIPLTVLHQAGESKLEFSFGANQTLHLFMPKEMSFSFPRETDESFKFSPRLSAVLRQLSTDPVPEIRMEAMFALAVNGEKVDYGKLAELLPSFDASLIHDRLRQISEKQRQSSLPEEMRVLLPFVDKDEVEEWERRFTAAMPEEKKAQREEIAEIRQTVEKPAVGGGTPAAETGKKVVAVGKKLPVIVYFHKNGCADCRAVEKLLQELRRDIPGLKIRDYGIETADALRLNEAYSEKFKVPDRLRLLAPAVFTGAGALVKDRITAMELRRLLAQPAAADSDWLIEPPTEPQNEVMAASGQRIEQRYRAVGWWLVIGAGLLDGINPCAFAAIIFLISYLTIARRGRREIFQVGAAFAAGMFAAYYLLGLGLAEILAGIAFFHTAGVWLNRIMAIGVLFLAGFSIYDGIKCRRGQAAEMTLQLPDKWKAGIHTAIRTGARQSRFVLAALVAGVVVAVLELACTGQIYAPVILYIIKTESRPGGALLYLAAYNLAFVLPLLAVALAAGYGVGSATLTALMRRHAATVKFATAFLFLVLAWVLWYYAG